MMKKYRLTLLFAVTAVVVIVIAAIAVNRIIGDLAENNLIRIAEENTARDGLHMQAMIRRGHGMSGMAPTNGEAMQTMHEPMQLTLQYLTSPEGLDSHYRMLVEGLNIVKINAFDLNGTTVWSTDPGTIGITKRESPLYRAAVTGGISSKLAEDHDIVQLDGVIRNIDVVETYLPLRETREGKIIGVMEIYRDIANDVALQVDDSKATVLRTTIATMGGLFLVLLRFIITADVGMHRSGRREVALVEDQLEERKRAQEALTQQAEELARSNEELQQFAYVASHDLQEPLRMVTSYTQLLQKRYQGKLDSDADEVIAYAVDGASRMQELINDLLAFSRVGSQGKDFESTDCEVILNNALANLEAAIQESGATVSHDPLPTVIVDGGQLGQVFQNLTGNAIKYRATKRLKSTLERSVETASGSSRCGTTASASHQSTPSASSLYFNACTPKESIPARASAWPSARRLWNATADVSGWSRS